jgi:hypothetical protein
MIDLLSSAATRDIVLDRTHYGELIWPAVYGRKSILDDESIEALREIEESVGVQRIWMTDNNIEAHWKRCVDNKEPLDKAQFTKARALYSSMSHKYGFEAITLQAFVKKFPDAQQIIDQQNSAILETKTLQNSPIIESLLDSPKTNIGKTPEQHKLEVANIINDILSRRLLKGKGNIYDDLENELRNFLNTKLGKLLGGGSNDLSLTSEEIKFYKAMYKRATTKGEV